MPILVITTTNQLWEEAQKTKEYSQSTIDSKLDDVGFIHATSPNQTIDMLNRHFTNRDDVTLLLVDEARVNPEVKFEKPLSGQDELFPHIYGPLNIDAVIGSIKPSKDASGEYITPDELRSLYI